MSNQKGVRVGSRPEARQANSIACHAADSFTDAQNAEWRAYITSHPKGTIYHDPEWGRLIAKVFGHSTCYWVERDKEGSLTGVLPLVEMKSRMFGRFQVSMPFLNYGGALGLSPESESRLMAKAADEALSRGLEYVEFREAGFKRLDWVVKTDKVSMVRDLPTDSDVLWSETTSKLRAQVRKPLKLGAKFTRGRTELLNAFYSVFSQNMRDLGTPVYPRRFFEEILNRFPDTWIGVVSKDEQPLAAGLLVENEKCIEIPWASSLRRYNRMGANMLLYWSVLAEAANSGMKTFDFGRSSKDSGTYRFKRQWGAEPLPLYWHYALADGNKRPQLNPENPKFKVAIALWRRLPLNLANRLGPLIVKNIP